MTKQWFEITYKNVHFLFSIDFHFIMTFMIFFLFFLINKYKMCFFQNQLVDFILLLILF